MVTFIYNGKGYTMPRETIRAAAELYRYENRLTDARIKLANWLFDDENIPDEDSEEFKRMNDEVCSKYYRQSVEELFSTASLAALAARFEACLDCNCAENDVWENVVREYFDFLTEHGADEDFSFDQFAAYDNMPVVTNDDDKR